MHLLGNSSMHLVLGIKYSHFRYLYVITHPKILKCLELMYILFNSVFSGWKINIYPLEEIYLTKKNSRINNHLLTPAYIRQM